MLRIALAALHLLALGIGLGAVLTRGGALRRKVDETALRFAIRYDMLWGIAALLWISTGLWRWLGSIEKDAAYYMANHLFLTKMACLVVIIALETSVARTVSRWRRGLSAGTPVAELVQPGEARRVALLSHIEAMLVVMMVVLAVAMARGVGAQP